VTPEAVRDVVVAAIARVAPEVDSRTLRFDAPLRDQVDLDSMDFLNVVIALHERLQVDIPEADYGQLSSVNAIVAYLSRKTGDAKIAP
jgi:acyl carrier protein